MCVGVGILVNVLKYKPVFFYYRKFKNAHLVICLTSTCRNFDFYPYPIKKIDVVRFTPP